VTSLLETPLITAAHLHRSSLLGGVPGIVHGITRRVPGAGRADGNVGYSAPRDREDAWRMRRAWLDAAGLDANRIVVAYQVHGADIAIIDADASGRGAGPESTPVGRADGLVTNAVGPVLMTLHADCMPVLLCDPVRRAVGTLHAGWRGTTADVAGAAVRTMWEAFGSDARDLLVYLGPAIGGCCYEVGEDVVEAWRALAGAGAPGIVPSGDRWRFELAAANRWLLERAGVWPDNIDESGICTRCQGDEWFTHRGQGPATGRYAAFIALAEES
jgi:YfiH family protein